jgi:hypothetical protein
MAAAQGISKSTVSKIWRSHNSSTSHTDIQASNAPNRQARPLTRAQAVQGLQMT